MTQLFAVTKFYRNTTAPSLLTAIFFTLLWFPWILFNISLFTEKLSNITT